MVHTIEYILGNQLLNQINQFDSHSFKKNYENNIDFQVYLILLDVFIDGIEDNLLDLTQAEAQKLFPFVKKKQDFLKRTIEVYKNQNIGEKLSVSYKKVSQITQDLYNLIHVEVDKNSKDYKNFLSFLAEESLKSPVVSQGELLRDILPNG